MTSQKLKAIQDDKSEA